VFAVVGYASVQARVRARRSRLLDAATWHALIDAPSLARTLDVLRTTPYGTAVASDAHDAVVLAELQRGLRRSVRRETVALAASVPPRARDLLAWHADAAVVQDLKLLLRALWHGHPLASVWPATTLPDREDAAYADLEGVRSIPALIATLDRSPFARPLADAWDRARQEGRPFYLEVALDLAYGRGLVARIEALSGGDREDAKALLGRALARANLIAAGRYRSLAGVSPEEVVNFCLHRDFGGGLAMVQRVAIGASLRDEAAALGVVLPPSPVPDGPNGERPRDDLADDAATLLALERESERMLRAAARARFGRQPFGLGLVLAYLIERAAEAADLIALCEAKAQELDPAALRARIPREVA
jgi:vacuolar-type H+-ATPase subunit C/Vma6